MRLSKSFCLFYFPSSSVFFFFSFLFSFIKKQQLLIASGVVHLTGYVIDEEEDFVDDFDDGDVDSGSVVSASVCSSGFFFLFIIFLNFCN